MFHPFKKIFHSSNEGRSPTNTWAGVCFTAAFSGSAVKAQWCSHTIPQRTVTRRVTRQIPRQAHSCPGEVQKQLWKKKLCLLMAEICALTCSSYFFLPQTFYFDAFIAWSMFGLLDGSTWSPAGELWEWEGCSCCTAVLKHVGFSHLGSDAAHG